MIIGEPQLQGWNKYDTKLTKNKQRRKTSNETCAEALTDDA